MNYIISIFAMNGLHTMMGQILELVALLLRRINPPQREDFSMKFEAAVSNCTSTPFDDNCWRILDSLFVQILSLSCAPNSQILYSSFLLEVETFRRGQQSIHLNSDISRWAGTHKRVTELELELRALENAKAAMVHDIDFLKEFKLKQEEILTETSRVDAVTEWFRIWSAFRKR
jgi:hypothetical protein